MILIKGDFFADLMIGPRERVTRELVDQKYNEFMENAKNREEKIYDETNRKKSAFYKSEKLDKLNEEINKKKKAYLYCSLPRNILLRNIIVDLNSNENEEKNNTENREVNDEFFDTIKQVERQEPDIKGQPLLRKTIRDGEGLETPELSIIELKKFDLVDVIRKLPIQIKRYKIIIPSKEGNFDYDFYTEGIDIAELQMNKKYRQAVLKAIELNNMNGENSYIGRIEKDKQGRYVVSKNKKIGQAVEFEERRINKKSPNIHRQSRNRYTGYMGDSNEER